MSAGLLSNDQMFSVREVPWHGLGAVLDKAPKDIDDALKQSGLDWTVEQIPVQYARGGAVITYGDGENPTAFVNVRSDDGSPLGIVTNRYRVLQNREAFSFLANLIGTDMLFETAGSLNGGKRAWVMTRLPEWVEIGGDLVGMYAFITNDHTGGRALTSAVSPIRIVCQNTLTWAQQKAPRKYNIAHIGDPQARLHEARAVLELTIDYGKQFKQLGDKLASQKISEAKLKKVVEELWPTDNVTDRVAANRLESQQQVVWLFKEGPTIGNAPGTKWCAANAICEFIDYGVATDHDGKLGRAMDDPQSRKSRAMELVAAA